MIYSPSENENDPVEILESRGEVDGFCFCDNSNMASKPIRNTTSWGIPFLYFLPVTFMCF